MLQFTSRLPEGWQGKAVFVLGAVLIASPWIFVYSSAVSAMWDAVALGAFFMVGSAASLAFDSMVADFVVAFMAIWLALSARILGFSTTEVPNDLMWVIGGAVFLMSLTSAVARSDRRRKGHVAPPVGPTLAPNDRTPTKHAA